MQLMVRLTRQKRATRTRQRQEELSNPATADLVAMALTAGESKEEALLDLGAKRKPYLHSMKSGSVSFIY
jgi:hypothetical protein